MTRNRRRLGLGTALISLHQVCESLVPILIGVIVDRAIGPGDGGALVLWVAALAVLFVVLTTVYRFGARQLMFAIAVEAHTLRVEVAEKITHPRGIRTDQRAGDLLTVSTTDTDNTSYLLDYVPRVAGAVTATVVSAVALLVIDWRLGLAVLAGTPVVLLALQAGTPLITKRVTEQQERAAEATSLATDLVSGLRPLRGLGAEEAAAQRYREVSRRSLRAVVRAARTQGVYVAASTTCGALLACGIAILAGWFALTGRISAGELITVIGLAQFLMEPIGLLAIVPSWVAEARASAERVAVVLNATPLVPDGTEPLGDGVPGDGVLGSGAVGDGASADGAPGLEVRALRYGTLDGVDLLVRPGEFVGVAAHRSADGEALVKVLSGRVAPEEYGGRVLVGGRDLTRIRLAHARRTMLVEPHHTDLFTGTIRDNLTVGALAAGRGVPADPVSAVSSADQAGSVGSAGQALLGGVPDGMLTEVLAASAADQVLSAHPDGLEHVVTERGASLSGGQRQRVALARALLARPPILVLHDPTTAVDAVTEHAIAQGVRALRHSQDPGQGVQLPGQDVQPPRHPRGEAGPFTTVVVTSSPAMLAATDRVVVIDGGRVVAEGSHAELAATDSDYNRAVLR
ncbi:ABC transporter ATP-binding protein [Nonomuraea aurantiaca]|uniref:ABC transporter ATP-binding protein n=1 Tax=Nonomuraea aurantiaca TaxID=2878562 RepID=UPI001CD93A0D|nr:ABC transporter ATP-binding protein [Nonomuraea aurantiaca]MCA2225345.1 ABC transporter ATP-binding protein/permease [Nonomuraea aurantiaca]